ncbi:hypothetical protein SEA_PLATTE_55 [Microbacterium phage Platte]|nr:hypothetical protein SEA_PLATTE_55 [Microbacterium phage Platte]
MTDETEIRVILARLEGKLDANMASQGGDIETLKANDSDKELRLRAVEHRPTVSPGQLWTGILGAIAGASGIAGLMRVLFPA